MQGLKIELPIAAFLTAALYLNAYFFQVGVLAFYGYPNITGSFNVSYLIEGVVPGILFYLLSLFSYSILSVIKKKTIILFFILLALPLVLFSFWIYKINLFEKEIGVHRFREKVSIVLLIISFYGSMVAFSNFRRPQTMNVKFKYAYALLTMLSMIFSGTALGRMSSYYLGDVYKIDGEKTAYVLKVYSDKMVIADCKSPVIKYTLESDFSKIRMMKMLDEKDIKGFRECLFKSLKEYDT